MRTAFAFAEILEMVDGVTSATHANSSSSSYSYNIESVIEPANLAYLIGNTSIYTSARQARGTPYAKYKPVMKSRADHTFTEEQALAFADLSQWCSALTRNFTFKELRNSYRIAMLKTHPDQGGSSENFWSVRKSYEVLVSLVKN